jgi:lysophospholipase L1-like esterase
MGILKKTTLVGFGVVLALVSIEIFLQGAHWYARKTRLKDLIGDGHETVKILCLGESTTESGGWSHPGSWPKLLEQMLSKKLNRDVIVYNRGIVGSNTTQVLENLTTWIAELKPTIVITMLGINDDLNVLVYHTANESDALQILDRFRLYKLVRLLLRSQLAHILPIVDAAKNQQSDQLIELLSKKDAALQASNNLALIPIMESLAEKDPSTPIYYYGYLKDLLFYSNAQEELLSYLKKLRGMDVIAQLDEQTHQELYDRLGELALDRFSEFRLRLTLLELLNRHDQALTLIDKTLEDLEMRPYAAARLASHKLQFAKEESFSAWQNLFQILKERPILRRAVALYLIHSSEFELSSLFLVNDDESQMVNDLDKSRGVVLRHKALALWMSKNFEQAERIFKMDELQQIRAPNITTQSNYKKIITRIKESGATAIAMQYPMLSVKPLKALLSETEPDAFIDNEQVFKKAVLENGYNQVFYDAFAGSFGHTTDLGNQIIAENIVSQLNNFFTLSPGYLHIQ